MYSKLKIIELNFLLRHEDYISLNVNQKINARYNYLINQGLLPFNNKLQNEK